MKERPILFSGPMVRAILDGRKTQTRRIVKDPKAIDCCLHWNDNATYRNSRCVEMCPYGTLKDRLWVRETCCSDGWSVHYSADNDHHEFGDSRYDDVIRLHHYSGGFSRQVPSIHMPRWASRITLEITGVRAERLNEISEEDARHEGVDMESRPALINGAPGTYHPIQATHEFARLWNSINGPEAWAANPFVWVIEFGRIETQ